MEISLNLQPQLASILYEFRKAEVAKLLFKTIHESKEAVVAIKLDGVPRPRKVRIEEFDLTKRISLPLRRAQGRQALEHVRRQELFSIHKRGRLR